MNRSLIAILTVYVALALIFNWASPLFENSDEFFHFPFIRHLADNGLSLPVQSGDNLQDWRQEGSQPPLYHLISAALIAPLNTDDYAQMRRINPHAQIGVVGESNINHVLHPLDRSGEFTGGTALAVRLVRLFSTLLAGVVVAATYFLMRAAFPDVPRWVGLLAASLVAFNPMLLFVASSINNDNLANALIASVLALLAGQFRRDDLPSPRILLLVGLLLGLSMLSKLSTGPFLLIVGYLWLGLARKHRALGYMFRWGLASLALMLLIAAWWYIRNYDLYGDPTGLNVFLDIVGRRPIDLTAEQLWSEREGFIRSFWGLYGGLTVDMAGWTYVVFNIFAAISVFGFAVFVGKRWRGIDFPQSALLIWIALSFVFLIRWTSLTWASQGRLWFVALPALAIVGAVGIYEIARLIRLEALAWSPAVFALGIAIIAPFAWIRPAYAPPELVFIGDVLGRAAPAATFSDPDYPDQRIGLAYAEFPHEILAGESAAARFQFCVPGAELSRNWSVFVHLVNEWDIILAQADFTPGHGALPTSEMPQYQCWQDTYDIEIPPGIASSDTDLDLLVGLYESESGLRMQLDDGETRFVAQSTRLTIGDALQKFTFGDAVRLTDYALSESVVSQGDEFTLNLNWQSIAPLTEDYTIFVQIIDPRSAQKAAASDQMTATSAWAAGDQIEDVHTLTITNDAPAGVYAVVVGFYQQTAAGDFERLRLVYDGVDTGFDAMTLTQVRVE